MSRYRKKPIVIEAMRWTPEDNAASTLVRNWLSENDCGWGFVGATNGPPAEQEIHISTLEGTMFVNPGDWIIRGVAGEFYPCKPDIFDATYELVSDVMGQPA